MTIGAAAASWTAGVAGMGMDRRLLAVLLFILFLDKPISSIYMAGKLPKENVTSLNT